MIWTQIKQCFCLPLMFIPTSVSFYIAVGIYTLCVLYLPKPKMIFVTSQTYHIGFSASFGVCCGTGLVERWILDGGDKVIPFFMFLDLCRDYVIKWKHYPRYWPFVLEFTGPSVNFPHKGQWRGALMLFLICIWINGWANNRDAGDLKRYRAHYDVTVMH